MAQFVLLWQFETPQNGSCPCPLPAWFSSTCCSHSKMFQAPLAHSLSQPRERLSSSFLGRWLRLETETWMANVAARVSGSSQQGEKEVSVAYTYSTGSSAFAVHISSCLHLSLCFSVSGYSCAFLFVHLYIYLPVSGCTHSSCLQPAQLWSHCNLPSFHNILLPATRPSVYTSLCVSTPPVHSIQTCCSSPFFRDLSPLGTRIAEYAVNVVTVVITGYSYGFFCHF